MFDHLLFKTIYCTRNYQQECTKVEHKQVFQENSQKDSKTSLLQDPSPFRYITQYIKKCQICSRLCIIGYREDKYPKREILK